MAAAELFANTPATTVSSGGTDAPSSGTTETWTVATPGAFPAASTGVTQFHVGDPAATSEMIAVTNVSGTTWTVTRGAESTTPVAHSAGFTVQQVTTAGGLGSFAQTGQGDLGGTGAAPTVVSTHLPSPMPLTQGGTGIDAGSNAALVEALGALLAANNLSDLASEVTARANLGLGPVTLTDAATIAVNAAAGSAFRVTLNGNRTLGTPSNPVDLQTILFELIQGSGGGFTLGFSGAYAFPASIPQPSLSTTAGQRDFLQFTYDGLESLWQCTGWVPDQNAGLVPVAQGGTGQSTQQAAINALAGAQTSGEFPRGNGVNVVMSAIQAADLPTGTTSAQGALQLEGSAGGIQPVGTAAATGSTGLAPDAGHVHLGFYGGIFGTGADGAVTLDGTTTYNGFSSLAGSTYTLTRDVQAASLTINNGVTLKPAGYRIFGRGTVTNNGTISVAGNAASGSAAGGATGGAVLGGGVAGGAGGTGVSGTGASGTNVSYGIAGGNGGAGTSGGAGSGGTAAVSNTIAQSDILQTPYPVLTGIAAFNVTNRQLQWGAGGGGGGSDSSSNAGGGGGGGGGIVAILAWAVNNGSGTITVAGGNGGNGAAGNAGGGGGGSGGLIIAYTLAAWTAGTLTVSGGALGSKASGGTGSNGSAGGTGLSLNVVLS